MEHPSFHGVWDEDKQVGVSWYKTWAVLFVRVHISWRSIITLQVTFAGSHFVQALIYETHFWTVPIENVHPHVYLLPVQIVNTVVVVWKQAEVDVSFAIQAEEFHYFPTVKAKVWPGFGRDGCRIFGDIGSLAGYNHIAKYENGKYKFTVIWSICFVDMGSTCMSPDSVFLGLTLQYKTESTPT